MLDFLLTPQQIFRNPSEAQRWASLYFIPSDTEVWFNMVPVYYQPLQNWFERFSDTLNNWETILNQLELSYVAPDAALIQELCHSGEQILVELSNCQQERNSILQLAATAGHEAANISDLKDFAPENWPPEWSDQLKLLALQLQRVQQLSKTIWVSAFQSQLFVSEMLMMFATGQSSNATYTSNETDAMSGGFLINEAA